MIEAHTLTGPAKNLLEFCREVREREAGGVEVCIATFRRGAAAGASDAFLEAARDAGVRCEVIPETSRFDLRVFRAIGRTAALLEPDIIQTHNAKSHFLLRWSGLWKRYPWIAFHHGYTKEDLKMEIYNRLSRRAMKKARLVLTVTGAFEEQIRSAGVPRSRIRVLHNAISPQWSDGLRSEAARAIRQKLVKSGEKLILAVGRLSPEKGHKDLLEAVRLLSSRQAGLPFRLVLVGDGPERANLERIAQDLEDRVVLAGHTSDVRPYYGAADLLVLPSHSEGSPNVLLEAMAAGLPILGTAVGGVPEIVEDGRTALLAPPHDPEALANGIKHLLEEPERTASLGQAAAEHVRAHYSPAARAAVLCGIYEEITKEGTVRA